MIHSIGWFSRDHHGVLSSRGTSSHHAAISLESADEVQSFIGRPVKYFPRMTPESRAALFAAYLALKGADWQDTSNREIGLIATGHEGTLAANQEYFRDYVASGRTFGRGNLFIYTLPTSALGEVAIALSLTGPSLHVHHDAEPLQAMVRHAEELVADGEADAVLCLWTDPNAAVCIAVGSGNESNDFAMLTAAETINPSELADKLRLTTSSK